MKTKPIPPQRFIFFSHFAYFIPLAASIVFGACGRQQQPSPENTVEKNTAPITVNITGSNAPQVIQITAANMPKIKVAGKPTVTTDSSHGGAAYFTNYGTQQGLPVSTVHCSAVDDDGNMWFGTTGGASRYNGKGMTTYTMQQGLPVDDITAILPDKQGNIWFGTSVGISKYNGRTFTNYSAAQGLLGGYVFALMQDRLGGIWVGTRSGASRFDGKKFTNYTTAQGLADNFVVSMFQDNKGDIWFALGEFTEFVVALPVKA